MFKHFGLGMTIAARLGLQAGCDARRGDSRYADRDEPANSRSMHLPEHSDRRNLPSNMSSNPGVSD